MKDLYSMQDWHESADGPNFAAYDGEAEMTPNLRHSMPPARTKTGPIVTMD